MPFSILIVDDDPFVLRLVSLKFAAAHHQVLMATSVIEAKKLMTSIPTDVVLSDECMPGGSGLILLSWVQEVFPQSLVVLMTGYDPGDIPASIPILYKPAHMLDVVPTVQQLYEQRRA